MTASCQITRRPSGGGSTGPDGTWAPAAPTVVYTGPCRVQALATRQEIQVVGEAQETRHRFLVAVRWDAAEMRVGALVAITSAVDPRLAGKQLRVLAVEYGSEQWQRDLTCEELED